MNTGARSKQDDAKQVMTKFLKEIVLPASNAANTKRDFQLLSKELTSEACWRADQAGIKGLPNLTITSSFNERSLAVLYDVHTSKRAAHYSLADRDAARETIVFNGRNKPTANKILLADCYVDLVMPLSITRRTDHSNNVVHATPNARSIDLDTKKPWTYSPAVAKTPPPRQVQSTLPTSTPPSRKHHTVARMSTNIRPIDLDTKKQWKTCNADAKTPPLRHVRRAIPISTPPLRTNHTVAHSSTSVSPSNLNKGKQTTGSNSKNMSRAFAGKTQPPLQEVQSAATELMVPKRHFETLQHELNDTRNELAKALRQLEISDKQVREAQANMALKELDKQQAESDLKQQADVLAQTLSLLGDATAKLAKAKVKSDKENKTGRHRQQWI